eukprot:1850979-Rhodomonas_salina.1
MASHTQCPDCQSGVQMIYVGDNKPHDPRYKQYERPRTGHGTREANKLPIGWPGEWVETMPSTPDTKSNKKPKAKKKQKH